jgi:hypothetical protein
VRKPCGYGRHGHIRRLETGEEEEHEGCRFVPVPVFDASQIMHGKDPDGRGTSTFATVLYPAALKSGKRTGLPFGIRNPFSSDYPIQYENNKKSVMARLERIRTTAYEIIEKALGKSTSELSGHVG